MNNPFFHVSSEAETGACNNVYLVSDKTRITFIRSSKIKGVPANYP